MAKTVQKTVQKKEAKTSVKKSEKARKKRVTFQFQGEPGNDVFIVGSFNDWSVEDQNKAKKMKEDKKKEGVYSLNLYLPQGKHEYKFFSNGHWFLNPQQDRKLNPFGSFNNVISVN